MQNQKKKIFCSYQQQFNEVVEKYPTRDINIKGWKEKTFSIEAKQKAGDIAFVGGYPHDMCFYTTHGNMNLNGTFYNVSFYGACNDLSFSGRYEDMHFYGTYKGIIFNNWITYKNVFVHTPMSEEDISFLQRVIILARKRRVCKKIFKSYITFEKYTSLEDIQTSNKIFSIKDLIEVEYYIQHKKICKNSHEIYPKLLPLLDLSNEKIVPAIQFILDLDEKRRGYIA